MSTRDLPMMPWFPKQFDASTKSWAFAERSAYRELLDAQWLIGVLPDDVARLARIARMSEPEFAAVWPMVSTKFAPVEGGLINRRLEQHRKQSVRLAQAHSLGARTANEKRRVKRDAERSAQTGSERAHKSRSESITGEKEEEDPSAAPLPTRSANAQRVPHETFKTQLLDFKLAYPDRGGASQPWERARKAILARLREGFTFEQMLAGATRYAAYCIDTQKASTEYVMQAATFCGPDKHFLAEWKAPPAAQRWTPETSNGAGSP